METPRCGEAKDTNKFILSLYSSKCLMASLAMTPPREYPMMEILRYTFTVPLMWAFIYWDTFRPRC